jgi:hypothetical protein
LTALCCHSLSEIFKPVFAMTNNAEKDEGVLQLEKTHSSDGSDGRFDEDATQRRGDWSEEEERKLV